MDYSRYLRKQISEDTGKKKSERTRDRLKLAAVKILRRSSYNDLKITDICEEADIALGTFYLHFDGKAELAKEVLREFMEMYFADARNEEGVDLFEGLVQANKEFWKVSKANVGLLDCVDQVCREDAGFAKFRDKMDAQWYEKIRHVFFPKIEGDKEDVLLFSIYALGSMMEDFVRKIYVEGNPALKKMSRNLKLNDDAIAEVMSLLWYRALFCENPPQASSEAAEELIARGTRVD